MNKTPKPRPYIRSVIKRFAEGQKPRFTLVKIDTAGKRRRLTVNLVSAAVLPIVEKEFLRAEETHTKPQRHEDKNLGGGGRNSSLQCLMT